MAPKCTAEANGFSVECSCEGCGVAYNHDEKKYYVLCCGQISTFTVSQQVSDPPPKHHIIVDFVNITVLQAAQLLEQASPGKVRLDGLLRDLQKRVSLKGSHPVPELLHKLGLSKALM